ncbi:phage head spike fiber domain-containing protein [Ruegeria lacuscaerulensis]|uniref:phage head spike fiber domain-containing protein n=1 Tax=Ruegeria lacuscaerulensis TaxID=55218 RepID=UPI00147C5BF2|nr:hypothetical protein [Ruegeria lacuscaerulensis]
MKLTRDLSVTSHPARRVSGPALSLNFERQEYRRFGRPIALSEAMTFARASSARQAGASGMIETVGDDVLRRDHVVGTGAFRGALFEGQATNLLHYSDDFTQSYWNGYARKPSFVGGQLAPDGTASAQTWNCANTTGGPDLNRGGVLIPYPGASGTATVSIWLRASAPLTMRFGQSDKTSKTIDVTTQWQRFSHTDLLPNNQNRIFILYEAINSDIDLFIWGAQAETGNALTSNIATTGAEATRAADQAGLTGLTGAFEVTVTYEDDSQDVMANQSITDGWWPVLTQPRVKSIVLS